MNKIAKAIAGGITAGAAALGTAVSDGNVTATEWGLVLGAVLVGFWTVWHTPNAPAEPTK